MRILVLQHSESDHPGMLGKCLIEKDIAWYSFVFPESILYSVSIVIKVSGLIALFAPVSKLPMRKIKFDDDFEDGS